MGADVRYSEDAKAAFTRAMLATINRNHTEICVHHLVEGLAGDTGTVGTILNYVGITPEAVRSYSVDRFPFGRMVVDEFQSNAEVETIIEYAFSHAAVIGAREVTPRDLLIELVEQDSPYFRDLMTNFGLISDDLRDFLERPEQAVRPEGFEPPTL